MLEVKLTTPLAMAWEDAEVFDLVSSETAAVVYVVTDTDGNPDWGMPTITTVTVAAEVWYGDMDDDGDGEPVTTVEGLAALLGCEPTASAVAHCLHT
jgi:hypothetical protein